MSETLLKQAARLINKKKLNLGLALLDKALKLNPYNAYAWHLKSRVLSALNRGSEAQEALSKSKRLGIDAILQLSGRSNVPRSKGSVDPALVEPQGYVHNAETWTEHGASLLSLLQFEEALYCYNKALEIDPNYVPARENKDLLLKLTGWKE